MAVTYQIDDSEIVTRLDLRMGRRRDVILRKIGTWRERYYTKRKDENRILILIK